MLTERLRMLEEAGVVSRHHQPSVPPQVTYSLTGRGQDSAEVIERRMAAAREDISHVGEFDYVIINDDFAEAVADLCALFRTRRLKIARQLARHASLFHQFNP